MTVSTATTETYRRAAQAAALGMTYFAFAAMTVRFTRFEGGVAFIWAGGGLLLGALVSSDGRRWPELIAVCALASALATCLFGLGPHAAVPLAVANIVEATLGALLLRRFCPDCGDLKSVREIGMLIIVAGIAAPVVGAFIGATVATMAANVAFWSNWLAWYTGHALGTIAVAPLVILLLGGNAAGWMRRSSLSERCEAVTLLALLTGVTTCVFAQTRLPLLFLPFLPMLIAVFRLGRLGATASVLLIGAIASVCTVHGLGPVALIEGSDGFRAQFLQFYLATAVLMVLPAAGDLNRRKRQVEELQEQAALHRLILDHTSDTIMALEPTGRIRYASPSATCVLGLSSEALIGTMPHTIIHPDDLDRVVATHRALLKAPERTFAVEYRVVVRGQEVGWFETHARATLDAEGRANGAMVIVRDVTHRKSAEQRLSTAALTDPLTGIANRRAFEEALAARRGSGGDGGPAVIAIFDLDHFKSVNDTHGHGGGDQVLRAFAEVLRTGVRQGDMVARIGGEEFAAVISGDLDAARLVCERVRAKVAAMQVPVEGTVVQVTVSAGIAPLPPRGTATAALAEADAALYRAKAEGRNRLFAASAQED